MRRMAHGDAVLGLGASTGSVVVSPSTAPHLRCWQSRAGLRAGNWHNHGVREPEGAELRGATRCCPTCRPQLPPLRRAVW
jgi:hypothetical protein